MDSIILCRDFDISNIKFDDKIRSLDTGSRMKYISYNKNSIILQTPECFMPYGINNSTMDDENANKYAIDLSFRDSDTRPGLNRFLKILKAMDELIVQKAFENQKEWFRRTYPSKDVVEALYVPMVKYSKDKDSGEINNAYPPTFKMKIPYNNDKFGVEFFDYKGLPLECEKVISGNSKGARCITIARCNGIWFAGGKFGCSWKAVQVQIEQKVNTVGCAIIKCSEDTMDNSEDEEEEDEEFVEDDDGL